MEDSGLLIQKEEIQMMPKGKKKKESFKMSLVSNKKTIVDLITKHGPIMQLHS